MINKIQSQSLQAIIYTCLGYGCFTISDSIAKLLLESYSLFFVLFGGSISSLLMVGTYGLLKHGTKGFKTNNKLWHLARAIAITITATVNAMAFKTLQLDEFYAIIFTAPFILVIMAFIFLKESINKKQIFGIIAGFLCVLYMVRPGQDLFQIGALFASIGTVFYTINCLIMRILRGKDHVFLLTFFSSLAIFTVSTIAMIALPDANFPTDINLKDITLCISLGIAVALGMVGITLGMQHAPTLAVVAPFHYTQMIWGIIAGYLIFGDLPSQVTLIGATGLIITGIYVLTHETKNCKN